MRIAYYNGLEAAERLRIADETVANLEKRLSAARMLVEVGKRPPFDVTKSRIDLSNGRVTRLEAASALTERGWHWRRRSAWTTWATSGWSARPPATGRTPNSPRWCRTRWRGGRSCAAWSRGWQGRRRAAGAAQPVLALLTAGAHLATRGVDPPEGAVVPSWQVGVQLTVPLLAGGGDLARVREQEAVLQSLEAARSALVLQMRVEAQQLVNAVSTARARLEAAEAIVIQSRENLAIAEERYNAGVATVIELADAQATRTAADAQQARAEYDLAVARARLQRALGR